ncbi:hypothetical protein Pelo_2358 [Pelomyxa schiedti]|nr:hypothetical protein Pelo_2358 [Pelomyxa schiedti]
MGRLGTTNASQSSSTTTSTSSTPGQTTTASSHNGAAAPVGVSVGDQLRVLTVTSNYETVKWKGPIDGYLSAYCEVEGGRSAFPTLEEAQRLASECEQCGGITKESKGFTLRKGRDPHPSPTGEKSWIKDSLFSDAWQNSALLEYVPRMEHHIFPSLEAAMAAANILPECNGITLEPPSYYTLRCGNTAGVSRSGETSWLKIGPGQFVGPYFDAYLPGYCPSEGKHVFTSLEEAKRAALVLPCGGITMEREHCYTLRRANTTFPSTSGEVSWVKKDAIPHTTLWDGPHLNRYLGVYCQSGPAYIFPTLDSAKEAAVTLLECGGITQEGPNKFTLRVSTFLCPSPAGETSWVLHRT